MVDLVCEVPRLPASGEGVVITRSETALGGCAFNSATVIRQLGGQCTLCAPLGQGIYASFIIGELAKCGMAALPVPTNMDNGACTCLVEPGGERTMITTPGIERCFEPEWFEQIDAAAYGYALASGFEISGPGGAAIIGFLEAHPGIELFYAPGPLVKDVGADKDGRINALKPVWHLNDLEALSYTGRASIEAAGREICGRCGNVVIVTQGSKGAHAFVGDEHIFVPATPVVPVDTVGAGDAHLGALVAARSLGWGWERALRLANEVAAEVCLVRGATLPAGCITPIVGAGAGAGVAA
jgi:sugar/nucleoside kinase (ribokinase family)